MMRLAKVEAEGIRGIPIGWPSLPVGTRGLFLCGPNGTGKTSVIDAVEFLLTRQSTLFATNRMGVNWEAAKQHLRAKSIAASITLTDGPRNYKLEYGKPLPLGSEEWCASAAKSSFLLRRHMLLQFIDAQPKTRYEQLEPFLKLEGFIDFEEHLNRVFGRIDAERSNLQAKAAASIQVLRNALGMSTTEEVSADTVLFKLNSKLSAAGVTACTDLKDCGTLTASVRSKIESTKPSARYLSLMRLREDAQQAFALNTFVASWGEFTDALGRWERALDGHEHLIITDFLQAAKKVIDTHSLTECPVCETAINPANISERLQQRIDADARMTSLRQDVEIRKQQLKKDFQLLQSRFQKLANDCTSVSVKIPDSMSRELEVLNRVLAMLQQTVAARDAVSISSEVSECYGDITELLALIDSAVSVEDPGTHQLALADASGVLAIVASNWATYATRLLQLTAIQRQAAVASRIHGFAVDARKAVVQQLLEQISDTANRMYEAVHPLEKIAKSALNVRPTEDGSVILQNEFYGKTGSPRLHLSESHLDTLGLCYFLALRKIEAGKNPSFKFLILDDVMHSVDADHRTRVARLLKDEFGDHQIVITTHDDLFFQVLRLVFGGGGIELRRFHGWTIEHGPLCVEATSDLEVITDPNRRIFASKESLAAASGRVFEWMLRQLTESLQIAIPARFSRGHDIGSMWPALSSKLRKNGAFCLRYPKLCDDIDLHQWVRNATGAHYNEFSSGVTPGEVGDFAGLLSDFYTATFCLECGDFIRKRDSGDWLCEKGCLDYSKALKEKSIFLASA